MASWAGRAKDRVAANARRNAVPAAEQIVLKVADLDERVELVADQAFADVQDPLDCARYLKEVRCRRGRDGWYFCRALTHGVAFNSALDVAIAHLVILAAASSSTCHDLASKPDGRRCANWLEMVAV